MALYGVAPVTEGSRIVEALCAHGIEVATKLLGHTKHEMTEHYVCKRRGEKVIPVK